MSRSVFTRPNYISITTPRFDPYVHSGVIRGSAPPLKETAITQYPLYPLYDSDKYMTVSYQSNFKNSESKRIK